MNWVKPMNNCIEKYDEWIIRIFFTLGSIIFLLLILSGINTIITHGW